MLGGWEVTGIWHLQSGLPFSISGGGPYGGDDSQAHVGADRADVTRQPFNVKQGTKSQWLNQYFNPAAFRPNALGTFGDSPRNVLVGPHLNNVDLGIDKNFPFDEQRYKIQFRWEMFNAFNNPAFGTPNATPGNPGFGQITSTWGGGTGAEADMFGYPARVMQVALKFYF